MTRDPVFDRAIEQADIEKVAGVPLYRAGGRLRGGCPLCGASEGKKASGAFSVDPRAKIFFCHGCEVGGDVVLLEHRLRGRPGESMRDTAARMAGEASDGDGFRPVQGLGTERAVQAARKARRAADDARVAALKTQTALGLWKAARPAAGTPVETYLRARGITGPVLDRALGQLRYHPEAFHSAEGKAVRTAPAMIGLVMTPAGPTGGVHVTYLAADGRRRADLDPSKMMWGAQGRDGSPGGVWLTRPDDGGPLIVGEGIETALSAAILTTDGVARVVAALSLRALQGRWAEDRFGRRSVETPSPDPEGPAFTWPAPKGGWTVRVAVDRDMKPIKVKVRKPAGGTAQREIGAEERAAVCAALASAAWRRTGAAVETIAPRPGFDFNDELLARGVTA